MMTAICGADCCGECGRRQDCGGCRETEGHPFGGSCIAAECIKKDGLEAFTRLKRSLIEEINVLGIKKLHIEDLYLLNGFYINLAYRLPNGQTVKLLEDNNVYLGTQAELPESGRCYGIAADAGYLLVCEYGPDAADPQIVVYRRR